ncbi:hypothetical protein TNIN_274591, partial [Trichonephila inaurata madagascariensis]
MLFMKASPDLGYYPGQPYLTSNRSNAEAALQWYVPEVPGRIPAHPSLSSIQVPVE